MYGAVYARWANPAIYTDGDGVSRPVSVVLEHDLQRYGDVASVSASSALVAVRTSEVQDRPRREDVFTLVSGVEHYVDTVVLSDEFEHRCICHVR
jgi:hypothetical protein